LSIPAGIVEEVGIEVTNISPGDRVVIPFNISCGHCYTCNKACGHLRVPQAQYGRRSRFLSLA
jgi:Zn-dependent alcohol dehydrogenase